MPKRCGYHSGFCRSKESCMLKPGPWPSKDEWHRLAGEAYDCLYRASQEGYTEIRKGRVRRYNAPKRTRSDQRGLL